LRSLVAQGGRGGKGRRKGRRSKKEKREGGKEKEREALMILSHHYRCGKKEKKRGKGRKKTGDMDRALSTKR